MREITFDSKREETPRSIAHEEGYKDGYKVIVRFDEPVEQFAPTNREFFRLMKLWFVAEDHEFPPPHYYGRRMPWWYVTQICRMNEETAVKALEASDSEQRDHFEESVIEHVDETIEMLEYLKQRCIDNQNKQ